MRSVPVLTDGTNRTECAMRTAGRYASPAKAAPVESGQNRGLNLSRLCFKLLKGSCEVQIRGSHTRQARA